MDGPKFHNRNSLTVATRVRATAGVAVALRVAATVTARRAAQRRVRRTLRRATVWTVRAIRVWTLLFVWYLALSIAKNKTIIELKKIPLGVYDWLTDCVSMCVCLCFMVISK